MGHSHCLILFSCCFLIDFNGNISHVVLISTGFVIYDALCTLIFYKRLTEAGLNLHILIKFSQFMGCWSLMYMQAASITYLPSPQMPMETLPKLMSNLLDSSARIF